MEEIKKSFKKSFQRVSKAIIAIKSGNMVILTDDDDRENEGDLIFSAESVTHEKINFMAKEARGLICLSLTKKKIKKLELPLLSSLRKKHPKLETAFTISIEAAKGVSTGISAADRAQTIRTATDERCSPEDIMAPGHVFPLQARELGVFERPGHTEGSINLMELAEKKPAAVICEILKDNGEMARLPELEKFSKQHEIPILSIEDILFFKMLNERVLSVSSRQDLKTQFGLLSLHFFSSTIDEHKFICITKKTKEPKSLNIDLFVDKKRYLNSSNLSNNFDSYEPILFENKELLDNLKSGSIIVAPYHPQQNYKMTKHNEAKRKAYIALILKELGLYDLEWKLYKNKNFFLQALEYKNKNLYKQQV